ncbi:MAG: lysylphosphatidylglycerol synthase transmembrane domain-containing protein [Thermoguttaceae bacterium]
MRRLAATLLKIGISVGILAYLALQAQRNEVFAQLAERPKQWGLLVAACGVCFAAVTITLVRWHLLVRALDLPLRLGEALRLGFLGYLVNLAPMGIVGGDLLKAVLLARRQHGHRAEAVASVLVDRLLGLYVMFVVASTAILLTGLDRSPVPGIQLVCQAALAATAAGTVLVVLPLFPGLTGGRPARLLGRIPYIGHMLRRLLEAVGMYRFRLGTLAACCAISAAVDGLFAVGIYLIARGLFDPVHSLGTHFVVVPLSAATGVLPVSLGPYEAVLDLFYAHIPLPGGGQMRLGQGLIVALGYRIITLLIAALGICYYLGSRQELSEGIDQARQLK